MPKAIADMVIKAEDMTLENYKIRALLSSPGSGAGKTTGACTLPGRKLLIDLDDRSEVIAGFKNIEILKLFEEDPNSAQVWLNLEEVKKELWSSARATAKGAKFPYDSIITDGNTGLFRVAMQWALTLNPKRGLGGTPAEHHWSPQMKNAMDFILAMRSLPCHIAFTGHEDLYEGGGGQAYCWLPKVTGKLKTEVAKWFNETYYCYSEEVTQANKKVQRFYWRTQMTPKRQYLKSSMNQLGKYWTDPIEINFDKSPVGFEDLLQRRFGKENIT